jgi:hypothetical protein
MTGHSIQFSGSGVGVEVGVACGFASKVGVWSGIGEEVARLLAGMDSEGAAVGLSAEASKVSPRSAGVAVNSGDFIGEAGSSAPGKVEQPINPVKAQRRKSTIHFIEHRLYRTVSGFDANSGLMLVY